MAEHAAPFLNAVASNFSNMIYDYINAQSTHKTLNDALPPTFLEEGRHYANTAQHAVFSNSIQNSIAQVGIHTLLPEIMWSLGKMTGKSNKLDYKPFISLFNVTNATLNDPDTFSIANYASVIAPEPPEDADGQAAVSMKFKDGTDDREFRQLTMFGNTSVPRRIREAVGSEQIS
ncbi:hypothetical protein BV22DRAFT_1051075 [Leucogyrophana mollusca]|uniref:Uncharacterized protein n=1 Tax=Leucogyrophana mollusca TaxID=85980 RepID=A0ACB8B2N5_9AGAM|nr:hypothetical protein BV22DRAFT_1051075 [Leucogyrophana mollusca]